MKRTALLFLPLAFSFSCAAFATDQSQDAAPSPPSNQQTDVPPGPPPRGMRNPEFEAALDECRQSLGIAAAHQRPDPGKMETCLTAKGFPKPKDGPRGAPPHGHGTDNPQPPPEEGGAS